MRKQEGHQAWIVGIVEQGQRDAKVIDRPRIIEVITGDDGSVQVNFVFMLHQGSIFDSLVWKRLTLLENATNHNFIFSTSRYQ